MTGGRVLMIAHHFPPAGGSGSNRALAFARYLPAFGWRPTVITPRAEWAGNRDDRLLAELPRATRVVRTWSWERRPVPRSAEAGVAVVREPGLVRRHLGHARRFPDAHIGWLPYALAAARREPHDVAYSSSGPFTSHVVGLVLKRMTARPWVLELRDGWYRWNRAVFPDYPAWRDVLERRLEAAAIRAADRVVLVTERMAATFREQYTNLPAERFVVVPNGFDRAQFGACLVEDEGRCAGEDVTHDSAALLGGAQPARAAGWVVLHAGALYYGRSLAAFFSAVRQLADTDAQFGRDFRLRLLGTLDGAARAEVERSGLSARIEVLPQASHSAAIAAMRSADALLLVANTTPGAEATVPGKLFEYLAVGRPVVAIAPASSSTADVLRQTGGGWLADASDAGAITCALQQAFRERTRRLNMEAVNAFDRRRLTARLAEVFNGVCRA